MEHNATSAERVLPASAAKIKNISESSKKMGGKMSHLQKKNYFCLHVVTFETTSW